MEDLNFCCNSRDLQEGREGKEMDALEGDINKQDIQGVDQGEPLKPEVNWSPLVTAGDSLEENDSQKAKSDHIDTIQEDAAGFHQEASKMLEECVEYDVSEATFGSCHHLDEARRSPESFTEEDADSLDREPSDLTQSGESWEQMTYDSDTEEDYVQIGRKRNYSDLSTVRAESTDADASNVSLVDSDSFILEVEGLEPEVDTDGEYLLSPDSLASNIESMETDDRGMEDFGLVPMESPRVSLVSKDSQMLNELGAGSTAFHSLNFGITGADWHMALLPVKCLERGVVNVASLTLGTVGISVIPMVSPGTIDINPFTTSIGMVPAEPTDWETWSMDSVPLATTSAEYVNVDSITTEGVRELWHPLEVRLHALGEALTALDKKIEGFSPRIQKAETLLNEVELSCSHHAVHISDIVKENNALARRVLLLEERLSRGKQQIWTKKSQEET